MKRSNALAKLGQALTRYFSPSRTDRGHRQQRQNIPVPRNNRKPKHSRHQRYSEQNGTQATNCVRYRIVNADGTVLAVDVFSAIMQPTQEEVSVRERGGEAYGLA